jgi:hypothetical protein
MRRYQKAANKGGKRKCPEAGQAPPKTVISAGHLGVKSAQFAHSDRRPGPTTMNDVVALSNTPLKKLDSGSIRRGLKSLKAHGTQKLDAGQHPSILVDVDFELYPQTSVTLDALANLVARSIERGQREFSRMKIFDIILEAVPQTIENVKRALRLAKLPVIQVPTEREMPSPCLVFRAKAPSPEGYAQVHDKLVGRGALGKETYIPLSDAVKNGHSK